MDKMTNNNVSEQNSHRIGAFLIVMHLAGAIGLNLESTSDLFRSLVPLNLLATAVLLFSQHKVFNKTFVLWMLSVFGFGMLIEIIGVQTGLVFGGYTYGKTLGIKCMGVPFSIGLNWLVLIYSVGVITHQLHSSCIMQCIIGAAMLLLLDYYIEPVAMKLDFWQWDNQIIPIQNYIAWFVVSWLLLMGFHKTTMNKNNIVAYYLYPIQMAFFMLA